MTGAESLKLSTGKAGRQQRMWRKTRVSSLLPACPMMSFRADALYSSLATFATHPPLRHASDGRPYSARTAPRDRPYLGALLGADLGAV